MWASAPANMYSRTQIFSTTGEFVDGLLFPRQRVLQFPCVATAPDGSVVTTQAARSTDLWTVSRVLAATLFYGLLLWLAIQSDPLPAPLFAYFFWQDRKSRSAKQQLRPRRENGSPVNPDKRADVGIGPYKHVRKTNRADSIVCPYGVSQRRTACGASRRPLRREKPSQEMSCDGFCIRIISLPCCRQRP